MKVVFVLICVLTTTSALVGFTEDDKPISELIPNLSKTSTSNSSRNLQGQFYGVFAGRNGSANLNEDPPTTDRPSSTTDGSSNNPGNNARTDNSDKNNPRRKIYGA